VTFGFSARDQSARVRAFGKKTHYAKRLTHVAKISPQCFAALQYDSIGMILPKAFAREDLPGT
jgi:hypothetical protein